MNSQSLKHTALVVGLALLVSCGGGGGNGGQIIPTIVPNTDTYAPYIFAELDSDGNDNQSLAFAEILDASSLAPITQAVVTMNGVNLPYNDADQAYEGSLSVAPGENVVLRVTVDGTTYTSQGTQFASYPAILHPAAGETWHVGYDSNARWTTGSASSTSVYAIGIFDAGTSGNLAWPTDGYYQMVAGDTTTFTIPKDTLSPGDYAFHAEIVAFYSIPGAMGGSWFAIGGYNEADVPVTDSQHTQLSVTPTTPSVPKGLNQQLQAIGSFADNSWQDLTKQVTWSTSQAGIASVNASGLAHASNIGTADITAALGTASDFTTLTVTSAVLVSLDVRPDDPYLFKGEMKQFVAEGTYSDMSRTYLTTSVNWGTSDDGIASVSSAAGSQGMVRTYATGSATITAETGGISGSSNVTVSDWTLGHTGITNDLYGLAWSGSEFVAVGGADAVLRSTDGLEWTSQTSGNYEYYFGVRWLGTHFAATGQAGSVITSPDGQTWASQKYINVAGAPYADIARSGTAYVAVGSTVISYSADGTNWTTISSPRSLLGIVWSGTQFVAVGIEGTILTSPDESHWVQRDSGTTASLYGVTWSGDQFVATGLYGTILTSPDGITWTQRTSGTSALLYSIIWTGTRFIAAGGSGASGEGPGVIVTSPDGITWTQLFGVTEPHSKALTDVVWVGGHIIAVGYGGTVLISP